MAPCRRWPWSTGARPSPATSGRRSTRWSARRCRQAPHLRPILSRRARRQRSGMAAGGTQLASAREGSGGLFGAAQGGFERLPLLRQALDQAGPACAEEMRAIAPAPLRLVLQGIDNGNAADVLGTGRGDRAVAVLAAADWKAQVFDSADQGAVFAVLEAMLGGD